MIRATGLLGMVAVAILPLAFGQVQTKEPQSLREPYLLQRPRREEAVCQFQLVSPGHAGSRIGQDPVPALLLQYDGVGWWRMGVSRSEQGHDERAGVPDP